MSKTDIGNGMAAAGGTLLGISGFVALISGAVLLGNIPQTVHLNSEKAEKIANSIAKSMGYETKLISDTSLVHKNAKYLLTPYDSLYHDCTGQIPTENSFKWSQDSSSNYYSRTETYHHSSDYIISDKKCIASKKSIAQQFNAQYKTKVHSATYDPGNSHTVSNCEKVLIVVAIAFSVFLAITIIGCCLNNAGNDKNEKDVDKHLKNAPLCEKEGQAPIAYVQ